MSVILNYYVRILVLDSLCELAQSNWTTNTCHIFQTDFVGTEFNELVDHTHIIFNSVNFRVRNTQRSLRNHPCFLCVLHRQLKVSCIVKTAERTYHIDALCFLHLVHKSTNIGWHRIHT